MYFCFMELTGGVVTSVTFHNDDNGFSVVKVQFKNFPGTVTCIGSMPSVAKGKEISVAGHWESNTRFGRQFVVEHYTLSIPTSRDGIISFLSSGVLPGIGPSRARQIYDVFGEQTLTIFDRTPERLIEIPGIGRKTVMKIRKKWEQDEKIRDLLLFLQQFDVSYATAGKIYKAYGSDAREKISNNPYTLCEDIWGIGFLKADTIAQKMGFAHDSYKRIRAGILYIMSEASQEGHTCLPISELKKRAVALLKIDEERFVFSLDHAVNIAMIIREKENIYLPSLHLAEKTVAAEISRRVCGGRITENSGHTGVWVDKYEQEHNWTADQLQRRAVCMANSESCMLLTGGPGTGKTTVLKVIVDYFRSEHKKVLLTAPTGRAAQRMKEVTGIAAQTIHRLLEYQPRSVMDGNPFKRNGHNPLEADVVIVDEVSMLDVALMSHLCRALPIQAHLILVGDHDQLPSVGPGNLLRDLIGSAVVPHIHLQHIFRQAASSRIITAAHEINNGNVPEFSNSREENCFFIDSQDPDSTLNLVTDLVSRRLPSSFSLNSIRDIQVLSPMHKGALGTENLNVQLQNTLRCSSQKLETGHHVFYTGDKVMQIRNNYEKNIFNGDIGYVREIVDEIGLVVDFQGNYISYDTSSLEELVPAYCISIHKSQGSEFKAVILLLTTQHFIMLQRNLVYTALTRAKQICIFVGTRSALRIAVATNTVAIRYSCLKNRLLRYAADTLSPDLSN